jgi:hypothetical protein
MVWRLALIRIGQACPRLHETVDRRVKPLRKSLAELTGRAGDHTNPNGSAGKGDKSLAGNPAPCPARPLHIRPGKRGSRDRQEDQRCFFPQQKITQNEIAHKDQQGPMP